MLSKRDVKLDLFALALLALSAFVALALVSYDRADVPSSSGSALVYPAPAQIGNFGGRAGAWVADRLLRLLGVGAYYLAVSLTVFDVLLLMRRSITQGMVRMLGWLMSLFGFATLAAMVVPQLTPTLWYGPEIGPGGILGAAGRGLLYLHFATAGAYILTVTVIIAGLIMCTDYLMLNLGLTCFGVVSRRRPSAKRPLANSALKSSDEETEEELDDEEAEEEEPQEVSVKILGRRVQTSTEEEEEEEEYEEDEHEDNEYEDEEDEEEEGDDEEFEYEDDEVEEEEVPQPARIAAHRGGGVRRRLVAALGIKSGEPAAARDEMIESLEAASREDDLSEYQLPGTDMLLESEEMDYALHEKDVRRKAKLLEKTFNSFGFNVRVVEIETGPVIAQFEVELEAGLRLSKITGLADDLAIALRVPSVRIVAPIPGKNSVGIEVPNTERQMVRLREVMEEDSAKAKKMKIPIFLGKDVSGNPISVDLSTLPHLLIAGRTGTGKSVCLNTIITSMVMTRRPDEVKMLMIDPKMVELSPYKRLPHLMHPVVTDMKKAEAILGWAVDKMEERYQLLARAGVRHMSVYNQLGEAELRDRIKPESDEEWESIPRHLPYIVIIADEIADLMMTAAKEVEGHIIRLAQKSRAVGIHLVLATQKPTVDVITGLIKSNLPARIAFQVASRTDSRVVLDEMGAERLLGNGDLLFLWPGTSTLLRGQGTFASDDEINHIVESVATTEPQFVKELVQLKPGGPENSQADKFSERDELYESAIDTVVREQRGSVSLLQRALGIGYGRGARLIDFMAEDGIVGPYNGSQAREVLISPEQWAEMSGNEDAAAVAAPPRPKRNKISMKPAVSSPAELVEDEELEEEFEYEEAEFDEEHEEESDDGEEYEDDELVEDDEEDAGDEEDEYEEDEYEEDEYEEDEGTEDDGAEDDGAEDDGGADEYDEADDEYEYEYEDEADDEDRYRAQTA